jgi:hypothetical protein
MPEDAVGTQEAASTQQAPSESLGESRATSHSLSTESSESNGQKQDDGRQTAQTPKQKRESRYERTKRERAQFNAERAQFERQRQEFAQERARAEAEKNPKYTLDELRMYRDQWDAEGQAELVRRADKEIQRMEAAAQAEEAKRTVKYPPVGTAEHKAMWQEAERDLYQRDPDFMRPGTALDQMIRSIMSGPNGDGYRHHPQGIYAAYTAAKLELSEAATRDLRTKVAQYEKDLARYGGLTSIGGGAPARVGNGQVDFAKLSTKEMRARLTRGAKRDGVPWF